MNGKCGLQYIMFSLFLITLFSTHAMQSLAIDILIVTGGHEFEQKDFFAVFKADDIQYTEAVQPKANQFMADGTVMKFDVIVLYDLWQDINDEQKEGFLAYLKSGKGLVALHHSLGSYQSWDEFVNIVGGTYVMNEQPRKLGSQILPPSNYKHDETLPVQIVDQHHSVTKGLSNFDLIDEVYGNLYVQKDVKVLLYTTNPLSTSSIGWAKSYGAARVVCLQSGHGPTAFQNPNYRQLVLQAIRWTAKTTK